MAETEKLHINYLSVEKQCLGNEAWRHYFPGTVLLYALNTKNAEKEFDILTVPHIKP
jgi:hypothetical protein